MLDFQEVLTEDARGGSTREKTMGDHCGTILIVDHDESARAEAVRVAVRLGYDVNAAENAELILERLNGERPSLAILAVELTGSTSGLELLRELHDRFGEDLPVILVSGTRTMPLDRVAGLLLGADDYLTKPFDSGELLARVRRSLRRAENVQRNGNGSRNGTTEPEVSLSPREREILTLLAEGKTQAQIATTLVISSKTVATHIQHLLGKLSVNSRAQAVAVAYRRGLVGGDVVAHGLSAELRALEPLLGV
jgi:DNA-binding NarL/FixJ family response regulator